MNGVSSEETEVAPLQLFNCTYADCGATFTREWRLAEHQTIHTGEKPILCNVEGCGRQFSRKSHLSRHARGHTGVKEVSCTFEGCTKSFFNAHNLKRHVRYAHGEGDTYLKCTFENCTLSFKKRKIYTRHLKVHGIPHINKCSKDGCTAAFESHVALKAHEKTHAGYRCPKEDCEVVVNTWGKLRKHMAKHPATYTCKQCQKVFKKQDSLRRHKRTHALQKPVLLCPSPGCKAYFSTTFNLQSHIRTVHLQLLKYHCSFPECTRTFAMRESMCRHMILHDPDTSRLKQKNQRSKKSWQKRLQGRQPLPLVTDDLRRLFTQRMRISRRAKVETNLSGLFSERKIPHYVDPEVNLRDLFSLKPPRLGGPPVAPLQG